MLARFGIEPRRLFALTVSQYNAFCDYAARESRRWNEQELLEEMGKIT